MPLAEPRWIAEHGIGETRALLVDADRVLAAKIFLPGEPRAAQVVQARLTSRAAGSARGVGTAENGMEVLLDRLPRDAQEGALYPVKLTRPPIAERGRLKRAQGRLDTDGHSVADLLDDAERVRAFAPGVWEDIWETAWSGEIAFDGGTLLFSVTPAMTLVDIDGTGSPRELALAAVQPLAHWLRLLDLGGSIGIDFPTIEAKADRKAVDTALEHALADWPHERTAMNGFGFVQIVARLEGPSLLHRFATSRVGMAARMLLRRGELAEGHGPVMLLTCHPAVKAKLKPEWIAELERRTGRNVRIEANPGLALGAGQAQILADG